MKSDNKKKKATTVATIEAAAEQQEEKAVLTETADNAAEAVKTAEMKAEEPKPKTTPKPTNGTNLLEKVGRAAIRKHGFREVFVTTDGMVFALSCDAKNHAASLKNKNILKVTQA